MENRRGRRFRTRFDAHCSAGREEGSGTLVDISRSGARLEGTSLRPEVGTKVRLYLMVLPTKPFELVGAVVRHTDSGFAIEILESNPEIHELIDDVASLVSAP